MADREREREGEGGVREREREKERVRGRMERREGVKGVVWGGREIIHKSFPGITINSDSLSTSPT